MVGSATAPQLDLSYTVTTAPGGAANPVFLAAGDTDFLLSGGSYTLTIGGTYAGDLNGVGAAVRGGSSNTLLLPLNLIATLGPFASGAFSGTATGTFSPTANPFSLVIAVEVAHQTAGTSTGDLNLRITPVPEPSTWALMLIGPTLIGVAVKRRRLRN